MKEKFKNDKKSLILMGYSLALILVFVIGGVVTNNTFNATNQRVYDPSIEDGDGQDNPKSGVSFDSSTCTSTYYDTSKDYIFVGSASDEFIKNQFTLNSTTLTIANNNLIVKNSSGEVVKTWKLVRCSSDDFYFAKNFVYSKWQREEFNGYYSNDYEQTVAEISDGINVTNGSVGSINTNNFTIVTDDGESITVPLIYAKYNGQYSDDEIYCGQHYFNGQYLFLITENFDSSKLVFTDGSGETISNLSNYKISSRNVDGTIEVRMAGSGTTADTVKSWRAITVTSDTYDLTQSVIWANSDFDASKITINNRPALFNISTANYGTTIQIMSNPVNVIKTWRFTIVRSDVYDIGNEYINLGTREYNKNNINSGNGDITYANNKITVVAHFPDGASATKIYDAVRYSSSRYNMDTDHVYVTSNDSIDTIVSNITPVNATVRKKGDNQVEVLYNNSVIKTLDVVRFSSSYYDLSKDYIFVGSASDEFVKSQFTHDSGTVLSISNDNLILKTSGGDSIKTWKLVRCSTDEFYFGKNYAYSKRGLVEGADSVIDDIRVTNGELTSFNTNKFTITTYNGDTISVPQLYAKYDGRYSDSEIYRGLYMGGQYLFLITETFNSSNLKLYNASGTTISDISSYGISVRNANGTIDLITTGGDSTVDTLQSWLPVTVTSDTYNLNSNVIWANGGIDTSKITINNKPTLFCLDVDSSQGTITVATNFVVPSATAIKTWKYVNVISDEYDIGTNYINMGTKEYNKNYINNGNSDIAYSSSNNTITFNAHFPDGSAYSKVYDVVSYKSNKYDLNDDTIYVKTGTSLNDIISNIQSTNVTFNQNGSNQLEFIYDGKIIKTMNIVYYNFDPSYSDLSSYYDLTKEYVFTGSASNEFIRSKINNDPASTSVNIVDDKLVLSRADGGTIQTWKLVRCNATNSNFFGKDFAYSRWNGNYLKSEDLNVTNGSYVKYEDGYYYFEANDENNTEIRVPILYIDAPNSKEIIRGNPYADSDYYLYLSTRALDIDRYTIHYGDTTIDNNNPYGIRLVEDGDILKVKCVSNEEVADTVHEWKLMKVTVSDAIDLKGNVFFTNLTGFLIHTNFHLNYSPGGNYVFGYDLTNNNVSLIAYPGTGSSTTVETWHGVYVRSNDYYVGKNHINTRRQEFSESKIETNAPVHSYENGVYTVAATPYGGGGLVYKTYEVRSTGFADDNLYKCVVDAYNNKHGTDISYEDVLSDEQLATITSLNCDGTTKEDSKRVRDTLGIEKLTGLTSLNLSTNHITDIDLSRNTNLTILKLGSSSRGYNEITSLDLSNNTALQGIEVQFNKISSLNVSSLSNLKTLDAFKNELTSIDLPSNEKMTGLNLGDNNLTSVDVSHNSTLESLRIPNNNLTSIDVSKNTALQTLSVKNNNLTSLDLSKNINLLTDGQNRELIIDGNDYTGSMDVNVGEGVIIESPVKLPVHLNWEDPSYVVDDPTYAIIHGTVITAKKQGAFEVTGVVPDKYSVRINVNASGDYDLDIEDGVIKNVPAFTQLSEIASKFGTTVTVKTYDKNMNEVDREARTGDIIVVTYPNGNETTYKVSVLGDVTGDGLVTIPDVSKLYTIVLGEADFEELCYRLAGDVTKDGRILISDVSKLYSAVLGELLLSEGEVN